MNLKIAVKYFRDAAGDQYTEIGETLSKFERGGWYLIRELNDLLAIVRGDGQVIR